MDDAFITQHFDWNRPEGLGLRAANAVLRLLRIDCRFASPRCGGTGSAVEQRMNLFHLVSQVLAYGVAGEAVDVGTGDGGSAAVIETVIARLAPGRGLHVFDVAALGGTEAIAANFRRLNLRPPAVHAGPLHESLPTHLPGRVCFAHVAPGGGRSESEMREAVLLALTHLYPRLSRGAALLLANYCDPKAYDRDGFSFPNAIGSRKFWNRHPAVKEACDQFFADKPERVHALYAGHRSQGYFRKA